MGQIDKDEGGDPSNANNFRDPFSSEVNPRTGKLRISIAAPVVPGLGGLDVDLGIDYVQLDGRQPRSILGLPPMWSFRLSHIVGGRIVIQGSQSHTVDAHWPSGMKYHALQDMKLESFNSQPALPFDEAKSRKYLSVLTLLDGRKQYFDLWGRLIALADVHGNHILYEYQAPDDASVLGTKLLRIVDTHGQVFAFTYPDDAIEISLPSASGPSRGIRYEFDAARRLKAYQDPAGRKTSFTYAGGQILKNLLSRIDSPEQLATTFSYGLLQAKADATERRLDVVTAVTRTFQGGSHTTRYQYDPDGDHHNYTGHPTYSLSSGDALLESTDHRYRYSATVDDGVTLTRHTYNRLHLETRTDVRSSATSTDLIATTLFTYPDQGADGSFPAIKKLSANYQIPSQVETRTYNPGDDKHFRARKVTQTFNEAGQLTRREEAVAADGVTFQQERVETFRYDSRFGLELEKDVHDSHAGGEFSAAPVITRVAQELNATGSLVASSEVGLVESNVFKPSRRLVYTHDARGRLIREELSPPGAKAATAVLENTYSHDAKSYRLTVVSKDPTGASRTRRIDTATGQVVSETDGRGNTLTYAYDALGRKTSVVDALNITTRWTYDDAQRTLTVHNANGYETRVQYNGLGQVVRQADNAGSKGAERTLYSREYDGHGRLVGETGILGEASRLTHAYDDRGRLLQVTDAEGNVRAYEYDEVAGTQTESFNGLKTHLRHINARQQITREEAFSTASGTSRVTSTGHDASGHVVSQRQGEPTSASRIERHITRDLLGNALRTETQTGDGTTLIHLEDRDLFGNLTLTTRTLQVGKQSASARGERFQSDAAGRITQLTTPLGKKETFTYDANGNQTSRTDLAGTAFTQTYDAVNALSQTEFLDGKVKHRLVRTHEATTRRLLTLEHFEDDTSRGSITYTYTPDGRLTSAHHLPEDKRQSWEYSSLSNQLTRFTDAAGVSTLFTYTPQGRLQSLKTEGQPTQSLSFSYYGKAEDAAHSGKVKTLTLGSGLSLAYTYDGFGRILTTTARASAVAGTKTLVEISHGYDDSTGNLTRRVYSSGYAPRDAALNRQVDYQYNGLGQLTQEQEQDASGTLRSRRTYAYDAAGNVVKQTLTRAGVKDEVSQYEYDADNKLTSIQVTGGSTRNLVYDALGNLTQDGAGRSFTYNALGQLTGFVDAASQRFAYSYQPDGLRRSKRRANEAPVRFYYDAAAAPNITTEIQGEASVSHQMTGSLRASRQVQGSDALALLHDQSHVVATLAGKTLAGDRFSAYGETDGGPGDFTLQDNPFGFKGEYRDAESGLVYMRARYYDPGLKRFISRDSVPLFNRYDYADGNPVMMSDPTGNMAWWEWLTLGGALVVGATVTIVTAGVASGVFAAALASTSTLVATGTEVAIAIASGIAGAIVGSAITAIGTSAAENRWGADQFFNKDLGISLGVGVLGSGIGTALTKGGLKVASKLVGEVGRRSAVGKALAGFVGGGSESSFNWTVSQAISKGRVEWDPSLLPVVGAGGISGATSQFWAALRSAAWKRMHRARVREFDAIAAVESYDPTHFTQINPELDVPVSGEAWSSPPSSPTPSLWDGYSEPGAFRFFG
ncbi:MULTISPECIES: RHS repeat-associated core domain-containing protein [unclassified Corallococcus]|uniref:RHS repeat-associated core domain-containing protein n=1 Tax=unclassified Corallococcus TaxID=2685029 RepID=UPI001A8D1809|nr:MULTISPECIES: RHS repeat-associated core domain-containing protein [unclassified Corallococcus]MBN9685004.1 hypothetical protein [Corallococcus sp. NCSPR001]WAS83536.1 RHS repeat-associated core domain-containing protein [Corallococcus sp. NCRR]